MLSELLRRHARRCDPGKLLRDRSQAVEQRAGAVDQRENVRSIEAAGDRRARSRGEIDDGGARRCQLRYCAGQIAAAEIEAEPPHEGGEFVRTREGEAQRLKKSPQFGDDRVNRPRHAKLPTFETMKN